MSHRALPGESRADRKSIVTAAPAGVLPSIPVLAGRRIALPLEPPGSGISYGRTFVTQRETPVALVPVGYGDGYPRILSNKSSVLIHGQRAPIRGRVCMDQFVVDITDIEGVRQDDEVVLVGRQGEAEIRAEEVAKLAGTINYEVTTSLLPRVVRVYRQSGAVAGVKGLGEG